MVYDDSVAMSVLNSSLLILKLTLIMMNFVKMSRTRKGPENSTLLGHREKKKRLYCVCGVISTDVIVWVYKTI